MPQPIRSGISLAPMRRPPLIMATKTWKILHRAARSALDIRAFHGIIPRGVHAHFRADDADTRARNCIAPQSATR